MRYVRGAPSCVGFTLTSVVGLARFVETRRTTPVRRAREGGSNDAVMSNTSGNVPNLAATAGSQFACGEGGLTPDDPQSDRPWAPGARRPSALESAASAEAPRWRIKGANGPLITDGVSARLVPSVVRGPQTRAPRHTAA